MSRAEAAFFGALQTAVSPTYLIFAKVRLADICYIPPGAGYQAALNRVVSKHLDYLLCDPTTLRPIAAIELDDATHLRPDRIERDAFVDEVLRAVEVPLLRFRVRGTYDPDVLRTRIEAMKNEITAR